MDALNMSIWRVQPCFRDHILNAVKKLSVVNAANTISLVSGITVENQEADEPISSPDIGKKITSRKLQMGDST